MCGKKQGYQFELLPASKLKVIYSDINNINE